MQHYIYVNDNTWCQKLLFTQGKLHLYGNMYHAQGMFENPGNFSIFLSIWFCWLLDFFGKFGFRFGDWTYDFVLS
jgi:hypothetical protein